MTLNNRQIEQIVQQVFRRLEAMPTAPSTPRRGAGESRLAAGEQTTQPNTAGEGTGSSGCLFVSAAVVSIDQLTQRLDGVRELRVNPKAIITPLASDELRERGIQVSRNGRQQRPDDRGGASEIVVVKSDQIEDVLAKTKSQIQAGSAVVVITAAVHRALCQLNRHPKIRATLAVSPDCVQEALRQISANVLVIDRRIVAGHVQSGIIEEFKATRTNP